MFFDKNKNLSLFRRSWGKQINKFRDMDLISIYLNKLNKSNDENFVDKRTWEDLNFNSIFAKIDRCTSSIGQQYLYYMLHKYEKDESQLKERFGLFHYFKTSSRFRGTVHLCLLNLKNVNAYFIPHIILDSNLPYNKFYPGFYFLSLLSVAAIIAIFHSGIYLFAALAVILMNIIINKYYEGKIYNYFTGFSSLNSLISSARVIANIKTEYPVKEIEYLKSKKALLKQLNLKLGYLVIDKSSLNELLAAFIEYLNMLFLFDIITYFRSVSTLLHHQEEIHEIYKAVAKLDASLSVASYLQELPNYTQPEFINTCDLSFENLYHPLIKDAVPNSLSNLKDSSLITGSNMSGKTTFIKTIGINFIFAQTLYISLAQKFIIPPYKVKTAIKREDDLEGSKSYFFAEIEELQEFIELSEKDSNNIFLIDEIFRGTNTVERLAASTSVLKYLDNNNMVLVTTHDIELQYLLHNKFKVFHFSDKVEDGKFFFDYKIHPGPCSSGNAIKLLEIKSYPKIITAEAFQISNKLLKANAVDENKYRDIMNEKS